MPIRPKFRLEQTEETVSVVIHVPHVRVSTSTMEIVTLGNEVQFYAPPYLLKLHLPGAVLDQETHGKAQYDPNIQNGTLTLTLKKEEPQLWHDLDLLGRLLAPSSYSTTTNSSSSISRSSNPIQILDSSENNDTEGQSYEEEFTNAHYEDAENEPDDNLLTPLAPRYGFLGAFQSVFKDLAREGLALEMLELANPDETAADERKQLRLDMETSKFDADRYLGDFFIDEDDYIYQQAISLTPHWHNETTTDSILTPEEMTSIAALPSKAARIVPSQISDNSTRTLYLGLWDLLFSYVYDYRMTSGDATVESSWTLSILSPILSWLDDHPSNEPLEDTIYASLRRGLVYPYVRNLEFLTTHCCQDVADILRKGRRCIIKCLLHMHEIFDRSELHYLHNRLYLEPYLVWIQTSSLVSDDMIANFATQVQTLVTQQGTHGWNKEALNLDIQKVEERLKEEEEDATSSSSSESEDDSSDSDSGEDDGSSSDSETEQTQVVAKDELHLPFDKLSLSENVTKKEEEISDSTATVDEAKATTDPVLLQFESSNDNEEETSLSHKPTSHHKPLIQEL
eukprot:CAMPEP_0198291422 /NCGR_PEP_ID=MMETSP1449-20131203/8951_1 /TAXON_ID=420275 /ORGANISM="Attheya septentrionalis, Strain CCMP2084" /LENGTH=567 /DNA_ID=CAMNT_0043990057 /DNA_START=47 /DNA_END=1750 /DNA_ORIENTATION=-